MKKLSDSAMLQVVKDPAIVKKMQAYIRLHGQDPSNDPLIMAGQVSLIEDLHKAKYRMKVRKNFISKNAFDHFDGTDEYFEDEMAFVQEQEYQNGFLGFDDDETEHLLPIGLLAKVGGKLLGKIKPLRNIVSKVGAKVKGLLKGKKAKQQEAEAKQHEAEQLQQQSQAINAGLPPAVVEKIVQNPVSYAPAPAMTYASADPSERPMSRDEGLQIGEKIIDKFEKTQYRKRFNGEDEFLGGIFDKKKEGEKTSKALDAVKGAYEDFKNSEKQKEIKKSMPTIIIVAIIVLILGAILGKKFNWF